jgi:hypothetical protein
MRVANLALAAGLIATSAVAQPRPLTLDMRCAQAAGIVAAQGAIVLGTGGFTYDRFVSDVGHCGIRQTTEPAWVPAADTPQCFVGYRCKGLAGGGQR